MIRGNNILRFWGTLAATAGIGLIGGIILVPEVGLKLGSGAAVLCALTLLFPPTGLTGSLVARRARLRAKRRQYRDDVQRMVRNVPEFRKKMKPAEFIAYMRLQQKQLDLLDDPDTQIPLVPPLRSTTCDTDEQQHKRCELARTTRLVNGYLDIFLYRSFEPRFAPVLIRSRSSHGSQRGHRARSASTGDSSAGDSDPGDPDPPSSSGAPVLGGAV